jgi:phospholipase C
LTANPVTSSPFTRRRLLGGGVAVAAATAALSLPCNLRRALTEPLPSKEPRLRDIKHVVLLMQENRSFDHYYGTFPGVRGFGDPDILIQTSGTQAGKSVLFQPDPSNTSGFLLPFHLDTLTTSAQAIPSTSHVWLVQHSVLANGANNNWLPAHLAADGPKNGPFTMGYYEEQDIPFQRALASAFTIMDNYFCSLLGPTHPNRYMWMTGTIDPTGADGGPALDNNITNGAYTWKTYAESLDEAGVSWKVYQEADNYGTNVLEYFKQFRTAPTSSSLFQNGMTVRSAGQFELDAINDNLPTVSWIFAPSTQSEHPNFLPNAGAAFVASKIDAIAANPEVWAKTVFLLTYDENDGIFDHVAPPIPPAGTEGEYVTVAKSPGGTTSDSLWVGPGFRVPTIIVSPWTAGGWVFSEQSDHTSHLQFLEKITGVPAPNISDWRRANMGDLTKAFRFDSFDPKPPRIFDTSGPLTVAQYTSTQFQLPAIPDTNQVPPVQPRGRRPSIG